MRFRIMALLVMSFLVLGLALSTTQEQVTFPAVSFTPVPTVVSTPEPGGTGLLELLVKDPCRTIESTITTVALEQMIEKQKLDVLQLLLHQGDSGPLEEAASSQVSVIPVVSAIACASIPSFWTLLDALEATKAP